MGERGGAWVARDLEARVRPSETPGGRLHTCVAGVLGRGMLGSGPGSTPSSLETKAADDADVFDVCLVQQVQLLSGGTGVSASDIGERRVWPWSGVRASEDGRPRPQGVNADVLQMFVSGKSS